MGLPLVSAEPARAMLLLLDGRCELVVTEKADGTTHRYRLDEAALAVLAQDAARCLSETVRRLIPLTQGGQRRD